jgi:integrase
MRTDIGYRRLLDRFGDRPANAIAQAEVEEWYAALMDSMSIASANHHLQLLRAILLRGVSNRRLRREDVPPMKLENPNNERLRYLLEEEEVRLLPALPAVLKDLTALGVQTGMRKGELINLRWPEVDFATGTIWVKEAKSGEARRYRRPTFPRFEAHICHALHGGRRRLVHAPEAARNKTAAMVQRYAHLSDAHLRAEVERVATWRPKSDVVEKPSSQDDQAAEPTNLLANLRAAIPGISG